VSDLSLPETRGGHVLATGIDIISVERVAQSLRRRPSLEGRLLTDDERALLNSVNSPSSRIKSIAARIAAKEAVMKCLGQGFDRISFLEVEIQGGRGSQPEVVLTRRAERRAAELGIDEVLVSLSHDDTHAAATAVATGECPCSPS
jgi:phosphopantetheine--protein transferase-like protein